jgi:hypothetical protein
MIRYLISLAFLFSATTNNIFSQTIEPIQTDRPDQTECPFIVPKYCIQAENGFLIEIPTTGSKNINYPSILWKFGINDRLEFRLITELLYEKVNNKITSGLSPITIGFKVNLFESKGILPITSFIGHLTTPNIGSKEFNSTYWAPSFKFAMQNKLSDKMTLGYNLGAEWDGETPEPTFIYSLTTGYSITDKIGVYAEVYGFLPQKSKADHRFDGGLTYLISNNILVDLSGGFGLTENAPDHYIAVGLSYRFKAIGNL